MNKIGFVTPWYGENIPGGAEMELRGLVMHLHDSGINVEIITTCVKQFSSDWNVNYYKKGIDRVNGILVRRFKVRKRDTCTFDSVNAKLMNNISISKDEEEIFMREMVNSPSLYKYIGTHSNEYDLFVFIPYMFGISYYGILQCPEKSILIPCFHDEAYIYLDIYKKAFEHMAGIIYLAEPEFVLANQVFDLSAVSQIVLGAGVNTVLKSDAERFRKKYHINVSFVLYAGRKDVGKNIYVLLNFFVEFKKRHLDSELKLVLIGGGEVIIPNKYKDEIIDLGFVNEQDKYDAYAAAMILCQPSEHESFSLVIMESWLCQRPVLVHGGCSVTRNFVSKINAGLYFESYFEFEGCIEFFLHNQEISDRMGKAGRLYVLENYSWDVIVKKYIDFFENIIMKLKEEV